MTWMTNGRQLTATWKEFMDFLSIPDERLNSCNAPRPTLQKTSIYFVFAVCFIFVCCIHHVIIRIASTLVATIVYFNLHPLVVAASPCFR